MKTRNGDPATVDGLTRALVESGRKMTGSRRAVVDLIASRDGTFDPAALVEDARRRGLPAARATIFRTLEILVGLHAVERLDLPNGQHSYVRCDTQGHHHHLVCTGCRRAVDLEDLGMTPIVAEVERRTGYQVDRHRLELFGLCPSCRSKPQV